MSLLPIVENQYGQLRGNAQEEAARQLGFVWGPIPSELIDEMDDEMLALEIKRRWLAKRIETGVRNLLDMRMLQFLNPERVQDHWNNLWTGKPYKKLRHTGDVGLNTGVYNWIDPIVNNLVGVLAGAEPEAFQISARPRDMVSEVAALSAEVSEEFLYLWRNRASAPYDRVFLDQVMHMVCIGRSWKNVLTDPRTRQTEARVVWPGHVAGYWQSDMRHLEQVIVARYVTLGEAVRLYPQWEPEIIAALQQPTTRIPGGGLALNDERGWLRYTVATLLYLFYRQYHDPSKIGLAVALLSATQQQQQLNQVVLERLPETGYTDIPYTCTPLFKSPNRPPDECQGMIFKIAGVNTDFDEILSATHDMLYREFYPTYTAKGFTYRSGPRRIGRSSVLALPRSDQQVGRIADAINVQGPEAFLVHLEDVMFSLGITNKYFLGTAMPSNVSADAIDAQLRAFTARLGPIRKELKATEMWTAYQVLDQQIAFGEYELPDGSKARPADILDRQHELELRWTDSFSSVKDKQIAMAAVGKIHSLDQAQRIFGITRRPQERRLMARERLDEVLMPAAVSQTAAAIIQKVNAERELSIAATIAAGMPLPKAPLTRVSLTGLLSPSETAAAASLAGIQGQPPSAATMAGTSRALPIPANSAEAETVEQQTGFAPIPPVVSGRNAAAPQSGSGMAAAALARRAAAASAAAAAPSAPSFEGDNTTGGAAPSAGDLANTGNANPATGTAPG